MGSREEGGGGCWLKEGRPRPGGGGGGAGDETVGEGVGRVVLMMGATEEVGVEEGVGRFVVDETIPMDAFAVVVPEAGVPGLELDPTDGPEVELEAVAGVVLEEDLTGVGFARIVTC